MRARACSPSGGLRVGELCAANIDDLGESTWHHTLTLRAETTKAGKAAVIALAPRTVQAIGLTRDQRRCGALPRNQHGRRMTSYNVAYLVKALCRDIGASRRITPHSLRHSAITLALDAGVGLRDVQDFARHTDPKTTRGYDRSRNQLGPPCHRRDRAVPGRRQLNRCPCPGRWAARVRPCLPGEGSASWLGDVAPRYHVR